jgi:hypothetical protein
LLLLLLFFLAVQSLNSGPHTWYVGTLPLETLFQAPQYLLWPASEATHHYFCNILLVKQIHPIQCSRELHSFKGLLHLQKVWPRYSTAVLHW